MPELYANVEDGREVLVRRGEYALSTAEALTRLEERVVNGRFRLLRWLGGTGTSAVYLTAFDGNPPRMAALKLVAASEPDAEVRLAGWIAAARLSHKNLIGIIDCGRAEIGGCQFVYEVIDYADEILDEILPARPLTPDEVREMLGPVLNVLEYMHAHGYAHGRIKPSNLLVVNDRLKLSGDSIALTGDNSAERAGMDVYEAPELRRGAITPAVDTWALGMTLVVALTQRPARWERWIDEEPAIPAGLAEPFGQIAKACLRVDPAERCTLEEIRAILNPNLVPRPATVVATRRPEAVKPQHHANLAGSLKPALIALAAVAFLLGAALTIRKAEFTAARPGRGQQQSSAIESVAATTPQAAIEKPSPSGRSGQVAPLTNIAAGPVPVSPGAESNGVLLRVNPEVLPAAQQSIRGEVNVPVRVTVDAAGNVTDAKLASPGGSSYFNRVAVEAARQWKFAAGASGAWQVEFQFRHDGTDLRATRE